MDFKVRKLAEFTSSLFFCPYFLRVCCNTPMSRPSAGLNSGLWLCFGAPKKKKVWSLSLRQPRGATPRL